MLKTPSERKITITWEELTEHLRKSDVIQPWEEPLNLTLMKPKKLALTLVRKTGGPAPKGENRVEIPKEATHVSE